MVKNQWISKPRTGTFYLTLNAMNGLNATLDATNTTLQLTELNAMNGLNAILNAINASFIILNVRLCTLNSIKLLLNQNAHVCNSCSLNTNILNAKYFYILNSNYFVLKSSFFYLNAICIELSVKCYITVDSYVHRHTNMSTKYDLSKKQHGTYKNLNHRSNYCKLVLSGDIEINPIDVFG